MFSFNNKLFKNVKRFANLRVILAPGALLNFSVSFQFWYMFCRSSTLVVVYTCYLYCCNMYY